MQIPWFKDKAVSGLFFLMMGIVCLLNVNYAILRSARNALVVADLGGGAGSIPWFELCGAMPGAILMTFALTWLLNRFSLKVVFFIVLAIFVGFFCCFASTIYPLLVYGKGFFAQSHWLIAKIPMLASMVFFVMAELWKIALLTILFWGLVNQYVPLENAKRFYAPLMLGGSLGTIVAGPLISFCTSDLLSGKSWAVSLNLMMGLLAIVSVGIAWLFSILWKRFSAVEKKQEASSQKEEPLSVWESIRICLKSRYLLLLAWVTIADYIAYALAEVIFFDILKQQYPDPRDYCDFMGKLSLWNGVLTAVSALVITPYLLRRYRWKVASLVTPVCLLVMEGAFFFAFWHPTLSTQIPLLVLIGSLLFCTVRAAKYTLFDTSKEISFLLLPPLEKMQGKLVIDGMCARIGRGSASFLSLTLIQLCGSVLATVPIAGGLAIFISASCVAATSRLGLLVDEKRKTRESN
jgi:AAA family ATP:ADP antiporter